MFLNSGRFRQPKQFHLYYRLIGFAFFSLWHRLVLLPLSLLTWANLDATLCHFASNEYIEFLIWRLNLGSKLYNIVLQVRNTKEIIVFLWNNIYKIVTKERYTPLHLNHKFILPHFFLCLLSWSLLSLLQELVLCHGWFLHTHFSLHNWLSLPDILRISLLS